MDATSYLLGKKAGGGSGTSNYNDLSNKPSINGVTLSGNKSTSDLGIVIPDISGKQDQIDSTHKLDADLVDDTTSTNKMVSASDKTTWSGKQDALVSGTNIKTINNESILGEGNITISAGGGGTSVYSYNFLQYKSDYSTDAPAELQEIMDNALADCDAGKTVILIDRIYSDTFRRAFLFSGIVSSTTYYFTEISYEYEDKLVGTTGYCNLNIVLNFITYGKTSKKIRMGSNTTSSNTYYISPKVNTMPFTPTANSHPTSKKYVDDKPTTYSGYDATKTQVLKNVQGTLTWVDE